MPEEVVEQGSVSYLVDTDSATGLASSFGSAYQVPRTAQSTRFI